MRARSVEQGRGATAQTAALDSQLARAEQAAARGSAKRGSTRRSGSVSGAKSASSKGLGGTSKGSRASRSAAAVAATAQLPRAETTPLGAIAPGLSVRGPARTPGRRAQAKTGAAPAEHDGPVDVESASAKELERLPRIGPSLARRIVADRAERGPFGDLQGLQRVRGIGPVLARQLEGRVTFGGARRP